MRFADPIVLWLLALLPLFAALAAASYARRRRLLRQFVSRDVLGRLERGVSPGRDAVVAALRMAAIGLFVVALARPQWGRRDEPVVRRGVDVVFVLDLSASMLAEDVPPNRIEEAKAQARSVLEFLTGDRVSLVVFGGRATVQCPLTLDYGAVKLFLDAAEPDFSPGPGSDLGRGLEEAARLFGTSERRYKSVVLLSDGEDHEGRGEQAAKRAHAEGVIVHAIGVGTAGGGPIPLRGEFGDLTGYKKDREGRVVTTRLDPATLEKIALAGGGMFLPAGRTGEEGRRIAEAIGSQEKRDVSSRLATRFEDRFQIPLALGMLVLIIEALWPGRRHRIAADRMPRRAKRLAARAAVLALALGVPTASLGQTASTASGSEPRKTSPSTADPAPDAPDRPAPEQGAEGVSGSRGQAPRGEKAPPAAAARSNKQANRLYEENRLDDALSRYEEASAAAPDLPSLRYNIGNVLYRQGKYDEAGSEYQRSLSQAGPGLAPAARYNLGNAAYQQKKYADAVSAYRTVLQQDPGDEAARRNLELALRMLKMEQQKQQSSSSDKDEQDQKEEQQQTAPQQSPQQNEQKEQKTGQDQQEQQDEKQQQEQQDRQQQQDSDERDRSKGSQGDPGQLDRKDAERLLDSLAQEEKRDLKKRLARQPRNEGPEKDW